MKRVLSILCVLACTKLVLSNDVVLCYWGSWANERPGIGGFGASDLPTDWCTHIAYAYFGINPDGSLYVPNETSQGGKNNSIEDFLTLKQRNSEIKLMIAIGGWAAASVDFSIVSNNATLRAIFVTDVVNYLDQQGLDGLAISWDYPGLNGGINTDREAYVSLLSDLRTAFESRGWLLTASVAVTQNIIDVAYDVPRINEIVDNIHLRSYDYIDPENSATTGIHAPLFSVPQDSSGVLNVDASVRDWLARGASASKVLLGVASYGRSYTLANPNTTGIGAPAQGPGFPGNFTDEFGAWSYYEICMHQAINDWSITEVAGSHVFGNSGDFWIGYDNPNTARAKGIYARDNNLAGVVVWAVDLDDFGGQCGASFPIIRAVADGLTSAGVVLGTPWVLILGAVSLLIKDQLLMC